MTNQLWFAAVLYELILLRLDAGFKCLASLLPNVNQLQNTCFHCGIHDSDAVA